MWRLCSGTVALLLLVALSPLVTPQGRYGPMLAGLPLTFWAGLLVAMTIALLTNLGARVHPSRDEDDSDPS